MSEEITETGKNMEYQPHFSYYLHEKKIDSWQNSNLQEGKSLRKLISTSNRMFSSTINDKFEEW